MNRHETPSAGDGAARVRGLIAAVRRRWFAAVALRAIGLGAAAAALPALAAGVVYWLIEPRDAGLLLLSAFGLLSSIAGVVLVARGIERRPDDRRVARFIEERAERYAGAPKMNDCVVSAVQAMSVPPRDERAPVAALVVDAAARCLEGLAPSALIPPLDLRKASAMSAGGLALLAVTLALTAPALSQAAQTARLLLFPGAVTVEVIPGDLRLVAGSPVTIRARFHAGGSALAPVTAKLVVSAGDDSRSVDMTRSADAFEYAFESVDRTFEYKVTAGPVESKPHTITALFAPRVKRIDIDYQYPAFSGLKPRTDEDAGDIYAPAGTKIRLRIHADKPLASAELALSRSTAVLSQAGDQIADVDLVLSRDDSYRIRLVDRDGLRSDGDSEYFIRLMDDRPPDVRILRPGGDQGITPLEEVAIEARAEDDYGVASLELVYSVAGGKERVVPFSAITGGDAQWTGSYLLAAEDLGVRPGDVITYYAKTRDVGRGKRPTETRSDIFFLEVRPFNEEFVAAQSQAGAGGGDPQIESLIEAQKEIVSATWNIERRAGAGRSADDMKAIAAAQTDLKARAERTLAGGRGRRGRDFAPQNQVPAAAQAAASQAETVAAALESMSRAAELLAAGKTAEAISHEMAALGGLLKLQAEVRRRQVSQQANSSGSGWGNRQTQDLTALFDKELQRQQRTNYEQRSSVQERPDQQRDADQETLDRIRDLARRQEALNREQREAAQLAAEERRRQLEKLMREQEELRRQAEELSRQMSGQQQSGQQQSGQQQSGQQQSGQQAGQQQSGQPQSGQRGGGNPGMREALEQMRQAAGDLSREDGESAARRGERAAEQLRKLEEQMRGGGADARQRAAADLQAEAQQILQEQRRIAAETERLEKGAEAGTADARRRLGADKDRLADRVDGLQREAERLGRQEGTGNEQARAREAAGQLEKERVGERMRDGAQHLRQGGQSGAQSEQQLARTMEQVVDRLGGGSAETRQLAEQLDRSRQLRERLDRLESGLKQAEARGDGRAEQLRQQYEQELRQARESLGRQGGGRTDQRGDTGGATPEQHEFSRSAPGTEAFKQDRSNWESLRKDVDRVLQERDTAASRRLAKAIAEDRLSAGGSEGVPDDYRRLLAKYYESLGRIRK